MNLSFATLLQGSDGAFRPASQWPLAAPGRPLQIIFPVILGHSKDGKVLVKKGPGKPKPSWRTVVLAVWPDQSRQTGSASCRKGSPPLRWLFLSSAIAGGGTLGHFPHTFSARSCSLQCWHAPEPIVWLPPSINIWTIPQPLFPQNCQTHGEC